MVTLYALGDNRGAEPTGELILTGTKHTGQVLQVQRNLAAANTDSPVVCFYQQNAGDDQGTLLVTNASDATAANPAVLFQSTNAAYDEYVLKVSQAGIGGGIFVETLIAGGGTGIYVDQGGDNYGIKIDSAATTNTMYGLQVLTGAGATAANLEYTGSEFMRCVQHNATMVWVYRDHAAADTGGPLLFLEQDNAGDDQVALEIQQDGTGAAISVTQNASTVSPVAAVDIVNTGNIDSGLRVYSDMNASAVDPLVFFHADNAAFDRPVLRINQDGVGDTVHIQNAGTGCAMFIDQNGNTNGTGALLMNNDGNPGIGLQVTTAMNASANFPLVQFDNSNAAFDQAILKITNAGTQQAISIDDNSTGTAFSIYIDKDGNNAARIWALGIDCDNAGAGGPGGIDMSTFTAGEPLLHVPVDATAVGNSYGRMAVYVVGVGVKYIELHDSP